MSVQQIFSLILAGLSVIGIIGSTGLSLTKAYNLGPGAMPLVYSVILLGISLAFFFTGRKERKFVVKEQFRFPLANGWIFYGLLLFLFALVCTIGTLPALPVFSVVSLLLLKRMPLKQNLLFTLCWVASLYVIFALLLNVPFEAGVLFE